MIKKYESFFNNFFKSKKDKKDKKASIDYTKIIEISKETFIELLDIGYLVDNKFNLSNNFFVQIVKYRSRKDNRDIVYKFIDIKDDVLSFYDRVIDLYPDINISFSFVYENEIGGLSCDSPLYEDFESGKYDNREVSIFTIWVK